MSEWDELSPLEIDNARLRAELAAERDKRRWNIEEDGNALLICKGHHGKYEGCTLVRYVPEAELAAERERANDMEIRLDRAVAIFNAEVAKNAKLREALEPFAAAIDGVDSDIDRDDDDVSERWIATAITFGDLRRARAALKETKGDGDAQTKSD
jgi:hypothetical protein